MLACQYNVIQSYSIGKGVMLKNWLRIIRDVLIVVGVLLSFFAFIEIVRAYQTLQAMNPAAGYIFLGLLAAGAIWLCVYLIVTVGSRPRVLIPPAIDDPKDASVRQLHRYIKYLVKYLTRLTNNDLVSDENVSKAAETISELDAVIEVYDRQKLIDVIGNAEKKAVEPMLAEIDEHAKKQVRASMRDVMLAVTLSPYKSADLMIVVYRNFVMIGRIIKIYNSRPTGMQQLKMFADIFSIVATVNYLNMGRNLIEALASHVPGIGRFTDDIAQGIGAGFMTTVAGHAAIDRCRAFRGWDKIEAKKSILAKAGDFYLDVKDLFFSDIFGLVKKRAGVASSEFAEKVGSALDETGNMIGKCISVPFKAGAAGTKAVVKTGVKGFSKIGKGVGFLFGKKK